MSWWRKEPEKPAGINLGRNLDHPVEVHYGSGTDDWFGHGHIWLSETRPLTEGTVDPTLADPRSRPIQRLIKEGRTDEQIAQWLTDSYRAAEAQQGAPFTKEDEERVPRTALSIVRSVRVAVDHANEPHRAYIYGLGTASKTDERILVTIDQDLIAEAPQVPFTETEKGAKRKQWAGVGVAVILYACLLFWTFSIIPTTPGAVYDIQAVEDQMLASTLYIVPIVAVSCTFLGTYTWTMRRVKVLDLQIEPVWPTIHEAHTEVVYLKNSKKTPASYYLTRLFRLPADAIRELAEEVGRFQADLISTLQGRAVSLRKEVDHTQIQLADEREGAWDRQLLGIGTPSKAGELNGWAIVLVVSIVAVVAVVGTYAALHAGG